MLFFSPGQTNASARQLLKALAEKPTDKPTISPL
jgi:hypothetical protein